MAWQAKTSSDINRNGGQLLQKALLVQKKRDEAEDFKLTYKNLVGKLICHAN